MIKFYFLLLFFIFSTLGFGLFLKQKILNNNTIGSLGEIGILGLIFVAVYATIFHFFLPLSANINIFFHIIGIIFFLINCKNFIKKFKKFEYFIFLLSLLYALILFYLHKPNEDFGFYHLPYIVNFTNEKIIFGLSSLQVQQGWNSIWLNIHSAFVIDTSDYTSVSLLNSIFFIFIVSIFTSEIIKNLKSQDYNFKIIFYFSLLFLLFFLIKFSRLNSYGIDVPGNFLLIIAVLYFFKTFESDKTSISYFMLITIFILFSITIRISNLPFVIIIIYLFLKNKLYTQVIFSKFFLFIVIFFSSWAIQQFIYIGCFVIPNELTCFDTSWHDKNFLKAFSESTITINKSYQSYNGNLTTIQYYQNFRWVPTWFFRNYIELSEYLITFCAPIIVLLILKKSQKIKNSKYPNYSNDFYILITALIIAIGIWFYNSPVIRMGNHFIMLFIFSVLINFNFFKKLINTEISQKTVYSLIIFSLLFVGVKNLNRISKTENNTGNAPWPKFIKPEYNTTYQDNLFLNTIIPGNDPQTSVCWGTAFICSTGNFKNLELSRTTKGYLFIKKKY